MNKPITIASMTNVGVGGGATITGKFQQIPLRNVRRIAGVRPLIQLIK